MKQKIEGIRQILSEHLEATKVYEANLSKLKTDTVYSEAEKEATRERLSTLYRDTANMTRDRVLKAVEEMKQLEKKSIDLSDNRLSNAVLLIGALKENTPAEILRDIESQFTGDQASLSALKGAYEKNNISTYALEKKVYNVDALYQELSQGLYDDFRNPEKIGILNRAFAMLDTMETALHIESPEDNGISINTLPTII